MKSVVCAVSIPLCASGVWSAPLIGRAISVQRRDESSIRTALLEGVSIRFGCEDSSVPLLPSEIAAGATGATLELTNVSASSAGQYVVQVDNLYGSASSRGARLTVSEPDRFPTISNITD